MRSASESSGFSPIERPRVAVAGDGTLAAIHEPDRITIVEIPGGAAFAEIGIDPEADASEAAWVSAPPRLLVLSRYAAHSTVHLLDPYGPRTIAEIRLESPMRLFASVGAFALAAGAHGAAVLTASDSHLAPHQFPARTVPIAAGAAGNQFVVALAGAIEEWDPSSRMPKRRLRLPRPAAITALGGSERVVWLTTQQDPARIDVIPLVNRGQPKFHDLPEPIAYAAGHPRSDLVACVGAETGRLYVIDLDGRSRLRVIGPEGLDRTEAVGLVVGRMVGVLAAQARHPVALVALDGRDVDAESAGAAPNLPRQPPPVTGDVGVRRSSLGDDDASPELPRTTPIDPRDDDAVREVPTAVTLGSPSFPAVTEAGESPAGEARPRAMPPPTPAVAAPPIVPDAPPRAMPQPAAGLRTQTPAPRAPVADRFAAWRARPRTAMPAEPAGDGKPTWRDELVAWARAVESGAIDRDPPAVPQLDTVIARFDLAASLAPVLALLYGAHLGGRSGAAPFDVARVLGRRWDEALGRGELAARGVARYQGSRVTLSPPILRMLDERPLATGELVGIGAHTQGALLGPCCVIAPADVPLATVAERCLASLGGAILIGRPTVDVDELFVEARAHAAVPLLRIDDAIHEVPDEPAIYVVADLALGERLGILQLA